jgi:peptidyl-tRNA hydrolase, PTH1 family
MKLIAGLGNPGQQYADTRHNVGFAVVDLLCERHGLTWKSAPANAMIARWPAADTTIVKPLTYMNLSGHAVRDLRQFYKVELPDLLVIVDEVQLELGRLRARARGSAGGHNGLKSLIEQLGTDQFPRLRIGVGRGEGDRDLSTHVLGSFGKVEQAEVAAAIARAADAAELFAAEGIELVMNRFNRKDDTIEDRAQ